ncbi:hypothetical protein HYDPIDRAFT_88525 [Hydnomerulius pinastri MD-312]|nr:hypothetical protein HYDPIDRAFT_88525 [Hydnomerulius pinastri MD-312]
MARSQLYPFEINPTSGEPFLRLPAPLQNIIITPPRDGDEVQMASILNDTRVVSQMAGIPIPYELDQARAWLEHVKGEADAILDDLRAYEVDNPLAVPKVVGGCPVRHIREVLDDGTDVYIGDVGVSRGLYEDVFDPAERDKVVEENNSKTIGDPTIRWAFGDYLAPSHHGRGIMSIAVGLILSSWVIPRMGRNIVVFTFAENVGSERVFLKNGFVKEAIIDNGKVVRGEKKKLNHLVWKPSVS